MCQLLMTISVIEEQNLPLVGEPSKLVAVQCRRSFDVNLSIYPEESDVLSWRVDIGCQHLGLLRMAGFIDLNGLRRALE